MIKLIDINNINFKNLHIIKMINISSENKSAISEY